MAARKTPAKKKSVKPEHVCAITPDDVMKAHTIGYDAGKVDGRREASVDRATIVRESLHALDARRRLLKTQWFKGTQLNELDEIEKEIMALLPK